jgi:hypothetical protein
MRVSESLRVVAIVAMPACYLGIGDPVAGGDTSGADDLDDDGAPSDESGDTEGIGPLGCAEMPDRADPLRRLGADEVLATVESLVGAPVPADVRAWLPSDLREESFSNAADALVTQPVHTEAMLRIAEWAATSTFADETRRAELVQCDPAVATCLREFIARFGRRAYRRALTDAEIDRVHALALAATDGSEPWAPFAVVVEATLQSPKFLLRPEPGDVDETGRVQLRGTDVAVRLAFALWGEAPDDALLDRADAGELDDGDGVRATAELMLADARARRGLGALASQWFLLPKLDVAQVDVNLYPELTAELRAAMRAELETLIAEHMLGDVDFRDLYVTESAAVTPALASLYGVELSPALLSEAETSGTVRIEFEPHHDRGGLLGRAGFLAMGAESWFASPVRRGLVVRTAALCDRPPPPPPEVEMGELDDDLDPDDALEQHSSDPACSGCHQLLDPVGWGLDRYDAIGRLRTVDESGNAVRESGTLVGLEDGEFAGARELGGLVANAPQATQCAVTRTADWLLARTAGAATACTLEEVQGELDGLVYRDLLLALVASDAFRTRMVPAEGDDE